MSTPENTFIGSVHKYLPPMDQLYHMKNHNVYNGGIADVWYSGSTSDLWVEYKFFLIPKRAATVVDLVGGRSPMVSGLQQEWLRSRYKEGRNVGVIVGCPEGGVWFPGTTWENTLPAGLFRDRLQSRKELAEVIRNFVT